MRTTFLSEVKKVCKLNHLFILLLCFIAAEWLYLYIPDFYELPYSKEIYAEYTLKYEGEVTEEKISLLQERMDEIDELLSEYEMMEKLYLADKIELEEYSEYIKKYEIAVVESETVHYLVDKVNSLNELSGFEKYIFNDTEWFLFFKNNRLDIVALIALLALIIPIFDMEFKNKSFPLIKISKKGYIHVAVCKVLIIIAVTVVLIVLLYTNRYFSLTLTDAGAYNDIALGNVIVSNELGNISLINYYTTDVLMKLLAFIFYALVFGMISVTVKNTNISVIASAVLMFFIYIIMNTFGENILIFAMCALLNMYNEFGNVLDFIMLTILKSVLLGIAICIKWIYD